MPQFLSRQMIRFILPAFVVMVVTLGCAIPFLSGNNAAPTATLGTPEGTPATPAVESAAPSTLLTQAAATLYAPLSATWTAQAGQPGSTTPAAPVQPPAQQPPAQQPTAQAPAQPTAQTPGQPPLIQPVQPGSGQPQGGQPAAGQQPSQQNSGLLAPLPTRTPFWAPLLNQPAAPAAGGQPPQQPQPPAAGQTPLIQPVQPGAQQGGGQQQPQPPAAEPGPQPGANLPQPSQNFLPFPLAGFYVQEGSAFRVLGVNLPVCGGVYSANFLVENTGTAALESLSYQVIDQSSSDVLFGPLTNNAPFMNTDTTCTPGGLERLEPGSGLFLGGSLGAANLTGQTVRVEMRLCTQDGLAGQCETVGVEFVVP